VDFHFVRVPRFGIGQPVEQYSVIPHAHEPVVFIAAHHAPLFVKLDDSNAMPAQPDKTEYAQIHLVLAALRKRNLAALRFKFRKWRRYVLQRPQIANLFNHKSERQPDLA
jgi:hypothetical protein